MGTSLAVKCAERQGNDLAGITETDGNRGAVDHCALWGRALAREGLSRYEGAMLLGWSEPQFAKAFSPNYPDQNVAMKRLSVALRDPRPADVLAMLRRVNRAYASLVAEANGLDVGVLSEEIADARRLRDALLPFVTRVR